MEGFWKTRLNNINDLHEFLTFIPEFFSGNGEATRINVMYDKLHIEDNAFKKIMATDLNISRSFYNEYETGFLRHLSKNVDDPDIIGITDITNDKFLNEIFEGRYNKPVETRLCDAVGNLEVLVELIGDINSMISNQNRISNEVCYTSYTNFTMKYLKKMIYEIVNTYDKINDSINGPIKPSGSYKLFI